MKPYPLRISLITSMLVLALAACNYPAQEPTPTATTIPPTQTPEPSPTPIPPTDTPTMPPTPSWTVPPPPVLPTATFTAIATPTIQPAPDVKFEASFEGGLFIFRTNDKGTYVIPKEVRIKKASCNEGRTLSDLLAFDPPPFFLITEGKFTISRDTQLVITGVFISPTQARGSIELHLLKNGKPCTIGPVVWVASPVP